MSMTRKDFEAIASIIAARMDPMIFEDGEPDYNLTRSERVVVQGITRDLAKYMGTTNPNFDSVRFFTKAGC